jgi:hypothetical protein
MVGCSQSAEMEPIDIQPVSVAGPPAHWDMSTRLMNRQSASTATLSGAGNGSANFAAISASMYYNDAVEEPFTGTVVMRAESLSSEDPEYQETLVAWLQPAEYPAVIFQSTESALGDDGFTVSGNLFLGGQMVVAQSRWRAIQPVILGEDLRKSAELSAVISATVPGAPLPGGEVRIELNLPVVGYTAGFVAAMLESNGTDVAALTGANPSYPDAGPDLSNIAWYLMLAGHTGQALDVYEMSLEKSRVLNTYLRMSDGYVFDGQYGMAVGAYTALEPYNVGQPHGLELTKTLGGPPLDLAKVAEINRALVARR